MTTVIISCKTMEVATDSQTTCVVKSNGVRCEHTLHYEESTKLHKLEDGSVFVGAGDREELDKHYQSCIMNGHLDREVSNNVQIAIVRKKNNSLHVDMYVSVKKKTWYRKTKYEFDQESFVSDSDLITIGSGGSFAYGAIKAGASVKEAIKVASECDPRTDDKLQYHKFDDES